MDSIPLQKALDMGMQKGAPDFKYIAEIAKEVQELNVPEVELQEANAAYIALPKVIYLPESESDREEEVMSSADDQIDDTVEQSSISHVENRTNLSIETNKIEVVADVRTEATELKSELLCKVCMTEPVSMIFCLAHISVSV
ncbi:hypothetical protein EB796_016941 [Bugula neritina]|uniref:Uncharacterized protein n=1 Tax=Bugula neritina TaxID=10212 RepID=A0A7J7JGL5_BUGNE|nr:hypothetical protein EB796_016941 [Bugula neritina]